ncbi:MAG: diguanylate cyclase [Pseudomonadota bacterium]
MRAGNIIIQFTIRQLGSAVCLLAFYLLLNNASAIATTPESWSALAQPSFKHYPVVAGEVFIQDNSGFVWMGTQSGLVRWDGYRLRRFTPKRGDPKALQDGYVSSLLVDHGGHLWIGTSSGGLARYDSKIDGFISYSAGPNGVSHVSVSALADDGNGGIWIGTGGGLDHMDASGVLIQGGQGSGTLAAADLPQGGISALLLDRRGNLWLGTHHGLFRRTKDSRTLTPVPLDYVDSASVSVGRLFEDSTGRIWAGTRNNGALLIDTEANTARIVHESGGKTDLQRQRVFSIVEVNADEIWLGTEGAGIVSITPRTGATHRILHEISTPDSLSGNEVHALYRERGGLIFVATPEAMSVYDPHPEAVLTLHQAGFANEGNMSIPSILTRPDGRVWLAVSGGGIDIVDLLAGPVSQMLPGKPSAATSLPSGRVISMTNGPDGAVYIGTQQGLFRHDGAAGSVQPLIIAERSAGAPVWAVAFQGEDLWFGGPDGIWKVELQGGKAARLLYHEADSLGDSRVTALLVATDGTLWVGTKAGLAKLDGASGKVQRFSGDSGTGAPLAPGFVSSLLIDRQGRLWISIFGIGVAVLERTDSQGKPHFRQLSTAEGLPHSGVNALREDRQGFIWVSTDDGLARIDPVTFKVRALGWADGVKISSYWTNSSAISPAGELMFGGASGLTVVRPERLTAWSYEAPLVVTAVSVNDKPVPAQPFNENVTDVKHRAVIGITPDGQERGFAVEFSALDFSAPERNRYAYRLLGFDKEWISTDSSLRRVSYTNLPPGEYTLQLRGSNRDGVWSPPLEVAVLVAPAWYQRRWVHALSVIGIVALLGCLLQVRTSYLRRHKRELQEMVNQRTAELQASRHLLEVMAYSDPLTGIPNRRCFTDELRHMAARATRENNKFTLLLIDLDHFKQINDTLGHDAGDALLKEAAKRMKLAVRESDRLARLGGDEFAVLLPKTSDYTMLDLICSRILASMAQPISFGPHSMQISASIGAAIFEGPHADLEELYKNSDLALYASKTAGRNGWRLHGHSAF